MHRFASLSVHIPRIPDANSDIDSSIVLPPAADDRALPIVDVAARTKFVSGRARFREMIYYAAERGGRAETEPSVTRHYESPAWIGADYRRPLL